MDWLSFLQEVLSQVSCKVSCKRAISCRLLLLSVVPWTQLLVQR